MKRIIYLLLSLIPLQLVAGVSMKIINEYDSTGIAGATVISKDGIIIGISNDIGEIYNISQSEFPITIRSLGFESALISEYSDTIRLEPAVYSLPEIEIDQKSRPIKKITCFVREYSTGSTSTDSMLLYSEYIMTAYFTPDKVKGYKKSDRKLKVRNRRHYAALKNTSGRDSVFVPDKDDEMLLLTYAEILSDLPYRTVKEPAKISQGHRNDTIPGEYSPLAILRKTNNGFYIEMDLLSKYKDHKWSPGMLKLFGATMDFEIYKQSRIYNLNDVGKYGVNDLIYSTATIQILGRGKLIKKIFKSSQPVTMYSYQELYPVEIINLSVEEYKEDKSDKTPMPFIYPKDIEPLAPSIQKLIDGKSM